MMVDVVSVTRPTRSAGFCGFAADELLLYYPTRNRGRTFFLVGRVWTG